MFSIMEELEINISDSRKPSTTLRDN